MRAPKLLPSSRVVVAATGCWMAMQCFFMCSKCIKHTTSMCAHAIRFPATLSFYLARQREHLRYLYVGQSDERRRYFLINA